MSISSPPSQSKIIEIVSQASPENPVDMGLLKDLAFKSLDNFPLLDRAYAWLAMTGFLKNGLQQFEANLQKQLTSYKDYSEFHGTTNFHKKTYPSHYPCGDFGLKCDDIMSTIHGDVVRTGRLIFFLDPLPLEEIKNDANDPNQKYKDDQDAVLSNWEQHIRRLERILYTFAMLNTGISYMQGFNELIFPFYYVLTKGFNWLDNYLDICECLAFNMFQWLFTNTTIFDFYTTSDHSIIMKHLNEFVQLQKVHLPKVAKVIEHHNIHPIYYCMRWFTLLFSQEHELPYLLSIWDALLSHGKRLMDYALYVALGHLKIIENKIIDKEYNFVIETLQNIEVKNQIKPLLMFAAQCFNEDNSPRKTLADAFKSFFK